MTISRLEDAFDKLADIVWWFHGFSAARPPAVDEGPGEHRELRDHAQNLRKYLYGLVSGRQRRIEYRGEERILISLAELEGMRDGLWPLKEDDKEWNRRVVEQRESGYEIAHRITQEYAVEERAANDPTAPF